MVGLLAQAAEPAITGLDVVNEVSTFFYVAWGSLLVTLAILGTVVGWIVPRLIARAQQEHFAEREAAFSKEIESNRVEAEIMLGLLQENLEAKINKDVGEVGGTVFSVLTNELRVAGQFGPAFLLGLTAARYHARSPNLDSLRYTLDTLLVDAKEHGDDVRTLRTVEDRLVPLEGEIKKQGWEELLSATMQELRKLAVGTKKA